jgi:hypothetical protein
LITVDHLEIARTASDLCLFVRRDQTDRERAFLCEESTKETAYAAGCGVDDHVRCLANTVVADHEAGCETRDGAGSCLLVADLFGNRDGEHCGDHALLRIGAGRVDSQHPVSLREALHAFSDGIHLTGEVGTGYVGMRLSSQAASPTPDVVEIDSNGSVANAQRARRDLGLGGLDGFQNLRTSNRHDVNRSHEVRILRHRRFRPFRAASRA